MSKEEKKLDLIIVGAGPAGMTAGIYAGRLKLNMIILEDEIVGGQIREAYVVENYPGFKSITGEELTDRMQEQVLKAGANIDEFDKIISVKFTDEEKIVETESYIYKPETVIIAAGSKRRPLPIPEEGKFHGNGIHYCELCDGELYNGKDIAVVGGGNSAVEAAIFLSKYGKTVYLIHKRNSLRADQSNQEDLFKISNIKVIWDAKPIHALGENKLEGLILENVNSKDTYELKVDGVFTYIGLIPKTDIFKDYINIDKNGYIEAGETTETNVKGVFAAGDVRTKIFRQLTTAVSDGTTAALMAEKYILEKRKNINK